MQEWLMKPLHSIPNLKCGDAGPQLSYLAPELVRMDYKMNLAYLLAEVNQSRLENNQAILHQLSGRSSYDSKLLI